jgi:hypothetical protein
MEKENPINDQLSGPPATVIERFWQTCGDRVPAHAIVFVSTGELDPRMIRTAIGRSLTIHTDTAPTSAFLFFVDPDPDANWAHTCLYVFVSNSMEVVAYEAEWPPHNKSIVLKQLHKE